MNKAITQGLVLMPPPFSAGLNLWSREDGLSGQGSYAGQPNAAYVPADQDFGGCLELQKTLTTQKLRCFQSIPFQPGLYLRVTVQLKMMSGALPSVRIAGWAGNTGGANVAAAVQTGPSLALTSYGNVVTVQAIIGSGNRQGVDMVWGTAPVMGHFGLDLTGPNGGVIRIDDVLIEDVTDIFHSEMFDWVDVRDYGAKGDGVTDDRAAFDAADTAALGKTVVVSPGNYYIATHLTFENPVEFQGTITMPDQMRLSCTRNFNLDTYTAAFGGELLGFKKALQALFYFTDHVAFDLNGRRVELSAPIDVAALAGLTSFNQRRTLNHGQLSVTPGTAWDTQTVSATATYSTANPAKLTGVANIASIPVGARVSGTGVGREVYVRSRNVATNTLELSQQLWAAAGTRTFTFERYQYMLDFSGFADLSRFEITDIEFLCGANASCINLGSEGANFRIADCTINRPKNRGITSSGRGCQDLHIDRCQFISSEMGLTAQARGSVAFNVNANDAKIRNNRAARFGTFGVIAGTGHIIMGNHFFQGDDTASAVPSAGLVFTALNPKSFLTGNYIDTCFIEFSNEHDDTPDYASEYSFGGMTMTGNVFFALAAAAWFRFIVITPRGTGHTLVGLTVSNNVFRTAQGAIDRIEMIDTTYATLAFNSFRAVVFDGNTFNGVSQITQSPLLIEHVQNTASDTWTVDGSAYLPFGSRARNVTSVVAEGPIANASNVTQWVAPYVLAEQGTGQSKVALKWPVPVKGRVLAMIRCDNPL